MLWAAGIFLLTFVVSVALFVGIIAVLPPDYFIETRRRFWAERHPVLRWLGIIGKNVLGVLLVLLGLVLSIPGIPGQGLLTIVIGAMLLDVPGKHHLVVSVVRRPGVLRNLNRLRAWFGRPPLVVESG